MGIRNAVKAILPGAAWQHCRVHFARNVTHHLGSAHSTPAGTLISTVFAQTSPKLRPPSTRQVIDSLQTTFRTIAQMPQNAEPSLTAFTAMPKEHWQKIWSNNPIEHLNREIKRHADVVQVFPDHDSITRLISAVLLEQHEEWQYDQHRYPSQTTLSDPSCQQL